MPSAAAGTYGQLRLEANIPASSADGIWWDISWALYFEELSGPNLSWNGGGIGANVQISSLGVVWSGTFGFDWRPAGLQSILIASGISRVYGNPDGTPPANPFNIYGVTGPTGSTGAGSGSVVGGAFLTPPTLRKLPGTPTAVAGARTSDTSITVSWAQSSATNGQPTSNTIRRRINGGAWADVVTISPSTSAAVSAAANQKIEYAVKAANSVGSTAWSSTSTPVYTTPAAPTGVAATKVGSDIQLAWTPNVAFSEHEHVVEHGVDVAGVITWDGSPLATVTSGTSTYTHSAPNPAQRHVYRVRARNTDAAALSSATVQSNVVQLLTAPAKPTVPALAAFADRAATFRFPWIHNAIDSSAQTKYQWRWSTNGGSSWTTGSKTTSMNPYHDFAGGTWSANQAVTFQVRTKGAYDSGSDGDASYSPWSDSVTVTFKSKPVATITSPANASTYTEAELLVVLGFSQAESATFVSATIGLYDDADVLLEQKVSTTLAGTLFDTRVLDGVDYKVKATVTDSNGLTSSQVTSSFSVDYTEPVPAAVDVVYLEDSGIAQVGLTIPAAGGGLVDADTVSIDRIIAGVAEPFVVRHPAASELTFLDITPTIHGTTLYRVTTYSDDGAASVTSDSITTEENRWAFMSKGSVIIRFELDAGLQATPSVDSALVKASGRSRPIGLYATTGNLVVAGVGGRAAGAGGAPPEGLGAVRGLPGKACYRDPTGRRVFGQLAGAIARDDAELGQFTYTLTETA